MPIIDTPAGTLEVTNAILSASEFRATQKISVSNSAPTKNFSVGDKFHVSTTDVDAVNITGNLVAQKLKIGNLLVSPTFDLASVSNVGNTTSNTLQFANATTSFVASSNVEIGGNITLTSNAQVKVGSNVLAEYTGPHGRDPKEMPLKKFPEIAFDASKFDKNDTTNVYVQAGYMVSVSGFVNSSNHPWKAFNGIDSEVGMLLSGLNYDTNGNANTSGTTASRLSASDSTPYGEWLKLELPNKIKLDRYVFTSRNHATHWTQSVEAGQVWGSNNDSNWVHLHTFTNSGFTGESQSASFNVQTDNYYKYYAFIITKTFATGSDYYLCVPELKYYGTEEPAPPGDLSLDTTLKSTFNSVRSNNYVMYFDGEDPASGNVPKNLVNDSSISITPHNAVFDTTNNCWTLNGSTESNVTTGSLGFEGDVPHTVSTWINASNLEANALTQQIFSIGSGYDKAFLKVDDTQIAANTWHNVTYAYQGEGGSKVTYVDGRKVEEAQVEDTFGEYPPFDMTDYETGGYLVSASSEYISGSDDRRSWKVFDGVRTAGSPPELWQTNGSTYTSATPGVATGAGVQSFIANGVTFNGHWLKLKLPHKLLLNWLKVESGANDERRPWKGAILGSNDDVNWYTLKSFDGDTASTALTWYDGGSSIDVSDIVINSQLAYNYILFVIEETKVGTGHNCLVINQMHLYGHKEGDLTRFPEPTRVLKYPHVAFPNSDGTAIGSNVAPSIRGYVATTDDANSAYPIGKVFDERYQTSGSDAGQRWQPVGTHYASNGGVATSTNLTLTTLGNGTTYRGNYIQLESPHKLVITKYQIYSGAAVSTHRPTIVVLVGSNTGNTNDWVDLGSGDTTLPAYSGSDPNYSTTATISNTGAYKYHRLVIRAVHSTTLPVVFQVKFFGTQENTGTPTIVGGPFAGKVANFRVYDQYLGDERIQEIYDAQKDEFGHKKSSMTFYKGRIGVGTTEPEGALTVIDEPHALQKFPVRAISADDSYVEGDGQIKLSAADGSGYQAFDGLTSTSWTATPTRNTRVSEEVDFGAWLKIQTPESMSLKKAEIESNPDWRQVGGEIQGSLANDHFGRSVACSHDGTRVIAGGYTHSSNQGNARVYDWNGTTWELIGNQTITGTADNDQFARQVAISGDGNIIAIAAPYEHANGDADKGVVRVYYLNGSTWTILPDSGSLTDASLTDVFVGSAANMLLGNGMLQLSYDGKTIAMCEYSYNGGAGRVLVYKYSNGAWSYKGTGATQFVGSASSVHFGFGLSMSEDGNCLAIGTLNAGYFVEVYSWDGTAWNLKGSRINQPSTSTGVNDYFGQVVGISNDGNTLAVGMKDADIVDGAPVDNGGLVLVYHWTGSVWGTPHKLQYDEATDEEFGLGLALSGDGKRLLVTAGAENNYASEIFTFEYTGTSWVMRTPGVQGLNGYTPDGHLGWGWVHGGHPFTISRDGSTIVAGELGYDTPASNAGRFRVFSMPSNIKSIWGSNDDVNWTKITTAPTREEATSNVAGLEFGYDDRLEFKNLDNPNYYKYHAIVADAFTRLNEVKLFGVRNQGSSTLHDGTLTLTKKVTAPQLESTGIINMKGDYTEIRANSNVVTCFDRSKKLIKYPRVAIASGQSGLSGGYTQDGYTVKVSNEASPTLASYAFNGKYGDNDVTNAYWYTGNLNTYNGTPTGGYYVGTVNLGSDGGRAATVSGDWIELELPNKIKLEYFKYFSQNNGVNGAQDGVLYARNTTNEDWTLVHSYTDALVPDQNTAYTFNVNSTNYYKIYALVLTRKRPANTGTGGVAVGELEFYGTPEYDPDAHGTDVVVKSVPNVPNTDWLEVYYDAKDLDDGSTTVNDLKPTGTAVNGTVAGNTSVTDGAFTFDGSGDYILSGNTSLSGTPTITYSVWFKTNSIDSSGSNSIVLVGYSGSTNSLGFRIEGASGCYRFFVYGGSDAESLTTDIKPELGKWVHATITFNSGTGQKLYLNGHHVRSTFSTTSVLNLAANSKVVLGNYLDSNGALAGTASYDGSIANFRLFNRPLSSDEIYQLYAYQKEYFGHGDLGMTLKNGRLGIGTSEPRALLQVGDEPFGPGSRPIFRAVNNSTSSLSYDAGAGGKIYTTEFNTAQINITNSYNTSTGMFTAPIPGYYFFEFQLLIGVPVANWGTVQLSFYKNGVNVNQAITSRGLTYYWVNNVDPGPGSYGHLNTPSCRAILYLNRGDYVQAGYPAVGSSSGNTSFEYSKNYAFFQGYLLST